MKITFETKYEPYQHLWMLDEGLIREVVPTRVSYQGDKRGMKKEHWEYDNTHCTYKIGGCWIDERKLFPTKEDLLHSLSENARPIDQRKGTL